MITEWPDNSAAYVRAAQVAKRLGYATVKAFSNARPTLAALGFPAHALPGRWRASQIERWESWNADRASHPTAANDAPSPAPHRHTVSPSPARQRLDEIQRAHSSRR